MRKTNFTRMLLIIALMMIGAASRGSMLKSTKDSTIVNFYYYSQNGTVYFTDTTLSTLAIASRTWQFGDSTKSTLRNPTHTYAANIYKANVCLSVKTISGTTFTLCKQITVRPIDSCAANFSYIRVDNSGVNPILRFTDTSFGTAKIVSRNWVFADSTTATDSLVTHPFASNLTTTNVCLTTKTSTGCQSTICKTITLKDSSSVTCKASFVATYQADSSSTGRARYLFTNTSSSNATSFAWMFGDGTTSTVKNPIHTYSLKPGSMVYVRLQIKTTVNCTDTFAQIITIPKLSNDSCMANFTYIRTDNSGVYPTVRFTDTSYGTSKVAWRQWSLSDSTHATDSTFVHQFASNLSKVTVYLTIGTTSGCQASIYKTITLKDSAVITCKASFAASYQPDSSGVAGSRYVFTNTSSTNAIYYMWSFGDGTTSTLKNPVHVYNFDKDTLLSVGLFIRSSTGCADSTFQLVTIHGNSTSYTIAGTVAGKDELLPQGIIALYKKATNGFYTIVDVKIISNGSFSFEKQSKGKYIIYAIPGIYYTNKYLPTYYVNKLHWADAQIIDLKSNAYKLTLQLVSAKSITPGPCKTSGKVIFSGAVEQKSLTSDLAVSYQVTLYTESGAVLTSVIPDESGNFTFDNLPYGKYSIQVEYPNLTSDNLAVNLSPEVPEATNLSFLINTNTVSVNSLSKDSKVTVYNVSEDQIAVRLNTAGKYNVSLINMSGQVVMDKQVEFEVNIDKILMIGSIPKGIYILKLQNNANTLIEKILK